MAIKQLKNSGGDVFPTVGDNEQCVRASVTTSTSWADTGVGYTIPANGWYVLEAYADFAYAQPIGVAIAVNQSDSVWQIIAKTEKDTLSIKSIGRLRATATSYLEKNTQIKVDMICVVANRIDPVVLRVMRIK